MMKFFSTKLLAILSAALMVASAPAISANIPAIQADFPQVDPIYVGLLTTIPSLFLILGVFLTSLLEKLVGSKSTILIGLAIVGIFGTLPAWYQGNFALLFISRALLGLGIGLFNRLLIQIIRRLYEDNPRYKAKALGLESAFEGLGGIMMTFTVGQLLKINWTYSFVVYAMAFLGFVLIAIFIPNKETNLAENHHQLDHKIDKSRQIKMYSMGFFLFCIVILFINYNLQITPLLIEKGLGNATEGSNMIAAIGAGAFLAGNLFGRTLQIFGKKLLPIAIFLAGTFIFLATLSNHVFLTLLCSMGLGFSFRNIMPYFMNTFTNGGEKIAKLGTTIVLVAYNIGATLSPYISRFITRVSSKEVATFQLSMTAFSFFALAVIAVFVYKRMSFEE